MANGRATVLCIDNDGLGLEARKELLETSGYVVLTACSGGEGLGLFASHLIDAVIVDYQMPEMSGDRVAGEMKRIKPYVPILMLSAYNDLPGSKLTHVDALVCKSESWPKLLSALGRVMETEVENTVKQLCAEASAQRNRRELKNVMIRLREFLRQHNEVLRSMSDDTFDALRKVWYS